MTTTTKGRARQQAALDFLTRYRAATTDQLATLIWAGDERLARSHLLQLTRSGLLRRVPHPLYRHGPYVYMAGERGTAHSQKVLHHLATVDFHVAVVRQLGRQGARIIPELPWAPGLIPDQTIMWREAVWAVEHHLTGDFRHTADYQQFMEEEAFGLCNWWRPGRRIGLLVVTTSLAVDHVTGRLKQQKPPGLTWRVATKESALGDPGAWLRWCDNERVRV